jgi:hypothetical protein
VGTLGRVVQRDRTRLVHDPASCAWITEDRVDRYHYDTPYALGSYGATAGRLSWSQDDDTTIAFGYSPEAYLLRRDQWLTATGSDVHSTTRTVALDGRTLTSTISSTYLPAAIGFTYSYDSAGHLAQVTDGGTVTYWKGTPSASGTGISDPLGRMCSPWSTWIPLGLA